MTMPESSPLESVTGVTFHVETNANEQTRITTSTRFPIGAIERDFYLLDDEPAVGVTANYYVDNGMFSSGNDHNSEDGPQSVTPDYFSVDGVPLANNTYPWDPTLGTELVDVSDTNLLSLGSASSQFMRFRDFAFRYQSEFERDQAMLEKLANAPDDANIPDHISSSKQSGDSFFSSLKNSGSEPTQPLPQLLTDTKCYIVMEPAAENPDAETDTGVVSTMTFSGDENKYRQFCHVDGESLSVKGTQVPDSKFTRTVTGDVPLGSVSLSDPWLTADGVVSVPLYLWYLHFESMADRLPNCPATAGKVNELPT